MAVVERIAPEDLIRILDAFGVRGEGISTEEIKIGNVNRTFLAGVPGGGRYILQRINTYAFRRPEEVMANAEAVTDRIRALRPDRACVRFFRAADGRPFFYDENGGFWRVCNYIDSVTYDRTDDAGIAREAGRAFGEFQTMMSGYDASTLFETIPSFHDTRVRFAALRAAAERDAKGRASSVRGELGWLLENEDRACLLTDLYRAGRLPLRVTHNDTKINNVLFEEGTFRPLTVIDLDTVMPGLAGHDFGDAIRFAANTVEEDCPDGDRATLDLNVFWAFTEGFLSETACSLTKNEVDSLAVSGFCLACELAVRFLNDYILGDKYFKISFPEHNLVRARCQIALSKDMLKKMDAMDALVQRYARKYADRKNTDEN